MSLELVRTVNSAESHNRPPLRVASTGRKHLTPSEVEAMLAAARGSGRHGRRDEALILLSYRHGLRVGEAVALRWDSVDFNAGTIYVSRLKNGTEGVHPLRGPELRALRQLRRDHHDSPYLFCSERRGPLTTSSVRRIVARAGQLAGLAGRVHPHQLRHATGFFLASQGQDTRAIQGYLGHRAITSTAVYTALAPGRFASFWKD
jgi:integrase